MRVLLPWRLLTLKKDYFFPLRYIYAPAIIWEVGELACFAMTKTVYKTLICKSYCLEGFDTSLQLFDPLEPF